MQLNQGRRVLVTRGKGVSPLTLYELLDSSFRGRALQDLSSRIVHVRLRVNAIHDTPTQLTRRPAMPWSRQQQLAPSHLGRKRLSLYHTVRHNHGPISRIPTQHPSTD